MKWFLNLFRKKQQEVKIKPQVVNSSKEKPSLTLQEKYPLWDSKQSYLYV